MLVGDTQRIWLYAERGFAAYQNVPDEVTNAYGRLVASGYAERLLTPTAGNTRGGTRQS